MASSPESTRVAALTAFLQILAVKKVWPVILAVALGLRLVALSLTWGRSYDGDPAAYMTLANNLIAGHGFGLFGAGMEQKALFPPLYPFLLAAVGSVFPLTQPTIFALNFAIDLAAAWVIAQLARELGLKPLLPVAIYLLWPSNVMFVSTPNKEGLICLLCALAAWFAVRKAPARFGVASGLLALTQPGLATLPIVFAILLRVPIAVSAGTAAVVMLPWWVRNYIVLGTFVPLTTASGYSFWVGTFSPDGWWLPPPKRLLVGDELRFSQVSAADAWGWIKAHPLDYARHTLDKLARGFVNGWWPIDRLTRMTPARPALVGYAPYSIALTSILTALGISGGIVARSTVGKLLLACLLQIVLVSVWFEFSERHTYFAIPFLALGIQALWASRSAPVIGEGLNLGRR
jgi:hypothetical protein